MGVSLLNKKILSIMLIVLLSIGTFEVFALRENPNIITETITLSPLQINENETYTIVSYSTPTGVLEEEGKPILPQITKTFTLPYSSTITSIDVVFSNRQEKKIINPIQPGTKPLSLTEINNQLNVYKNKSLYKDLTIYPQQQFEYFTSAGRKDNTPFTFVTVLCYPVQYNPQQQTISYCTNIEITVNYTPPQHITYPDEFDLVIISPDEFSSALQPLITHKNNMGIKTFLKTTEQIYDEYLGVDKPEQIKYFIKDALDSFGIKFVLLVGGLNSMVYALSRDDVNQGTEDWYLPVRYANIISSTDPGFISDLYYADIYDANGNFSSWDTNNDGIFAYFKGFSNNDIIDLVPELAVGRLACRNVNEVQTVVNKIINYETTTYGSEWEKNFVIIGGDTFDDRDTIPEGEIETQKSYDYFSDKGYQDIKIWASNRESGGLIPEPKDIVSTISNGAGFVHFAGHGTPEIWNTHWVGGPFELSERAKGLKWYQILKMTNTNEQPIVVIGGCHNSQFNVTMTSCLNYYRHKLYEITGFEIFNCYKGNVIGPLPECFSWFFVRQKNGGAIATIGNTGTGYGATGNSGDHDGDGIDDPDCVEVNGGYIETLFFKSIGVNNVEYVGSAWQDAITKYLSVYPGMKNSIDAQTVEQWVLLGDPSLKIGGYS